LKIKKRDSAAILNSLSGGVVPSRGLHHVMVGRTEEAQQILNDLEIIEQGSSVVKFYIGAFGTGKSFIQSLIQQIAFKQNYAVTKADFSPVRQLYGREGKAVATYTELMKNLAISTKPDGNALNVILEKWISGVQNKIVQEKHYDSIELENQEFIKDVEKEIVSVVSKMDELTGGHDFSRILNMYFRGFVHDDKNLQRQALKWLRGEYKTKTDARKDLGVREIITDTNYYDYIKVIAKFVKSIGYNGLVINFDEAINIYKITHSQTRNKNYETILKIFNDTVQGNVEGLYITFGGTHEFLEDERRGLFSYGALKRRLETNPYETKEFRDLSQPVIKLTPLNHDDTYLLLSKLKDIHAAHHGYVSSVSQEEIVSFINDQYSRPGAENNLTVGHIIKHFLSVLNIIQKYPQYDRREIFKRAGSEEEQTSDAVTSRFSSMEG